MRMRELILVLRWGRGNSDYKLGALAWIAFHFDGSAVGLHDFFREGQTKPGAMNLVLHGAATAIERIKNMFAFFLRNARTVIRDANFDGWLAVGRCGGCGDADPIARFHTVF